jgi:hypothetical protein
MKVARRVAPLLILLLGVAASQLSAQPANNVSVSFGATTVTASGITPGKSALFFASGIRKNGYDQSRVRITRTVGDDDRDGIVTFDLGATVPATTVWVVVDLNSGHFTLAMPVEAVAEEVALPRSAFHKTGSAVVRFGFDHPTLDLLYVHPGRGVWTWSAVDGRLLDRDGPNGVTLIDVADGKRADGGSDAASDFAPGGTLVAVDWYKMQYAVVHLDGSTLGGAQ